MKICVLKVDNIIYECHLTIKNQDYVIDRVKSDFLTNLTLENLLDNQTD